ncbi:LOW QUALITY PROTEIN: tetratricopeptide repeat protein 4-like [Limulus polyphemus]|uniref:LOW QUALITY PROTEIN: tetratricopeptide repeat protein 4-like n=1 Tax=Limulus polyphemus TaxID=6850 RepID=A0ABM1BE82_LIMPO|nr:LOW QUALITY PROTEIN: tetratricopeptide repeat protein 4-like [Limulus polyphemus]
MAEGNSPMTEEDRHRLVQDMDKDLDNYLKNMKPKKYADGWSEDNWEQEMQEHPAFRTEPLDETRELPPWIEALQQLKYDSEENTAEELALNYKDDGNENFRLKKYHWAIKSYTEGLKQRCSNTELNAQLLTNRAAANFHIGNYRSSFNDTEAALKLKPNHMKLSERGPVLLEVGRFKDCVVWCDKGLKLEPGNQTLLELRKKASNEQKVAERNKRKAALEEKEKLKVDEKLIKAIQERGIKLFTKFGSTKTCSVETLSFLQPVHPAAASSKVHQDENGALLWPVLFLYPEYGESDFIEAFHEDSRFADHLEVMFGSSDVHPPWDVEKKYLPSDIEIYFEDIKKSTHCKVDTSHTLRQVLSDPRYYVTAGNPTFLLIVRNSSFHKKFIQSELSE